MYLDINGIGIGNIVLLVSAYVAECAKTHETPLVYCTNDSSVWGLNTEFFEVCTEKPLDTDAVDHSRFCNLGTLARPDVQATMRLVVKRIPVDHGGYDAGFSIRTADPVHDGRASFMSDVAKDKARELMRWHSKVLVCSNDAANLVDLPPNAEACELTDPGVRNAPSHWAQWHKLAACPVVYHSTGEGDGSITSTFAPTAAVYGGAAIVGIGNSGRAYFGPGYRW